MTGPSPKRGQRGSGPAGRYGWMSSGRVGDMNEIITSPQSLGLSWNGAIVLVVARIGLG
jgi:hypothetical protein